MRLFHYALLPYLPELQFKGQLREVVAIMRSWRDTGKTNHLLINRVMKYERNELVRYYIYYETVYHERYGKWIDRKYWEEFKAFQKEETDKKKYYSDGWHNKEYLRSNMANLWEKHFMGIGKSRITDEEWETLCRGYKIITGEDYAI
jgi:uncharacterized protein (TIGR02328 family)